MVTATLYIEGGGEGKDLRAFFVGGGRLSLARRELAVG